MKTNNALQSVQAVYLHGLCMRIASSTKERLVSELSEASLEGVLVEYWGNWYIRISNITPEIGKELTRCTLPTDSD